MYHFDTRFLKVTALVCFFFVCLMPAAAQLRVDDVLVSKAGGEFSIRLNLSNLGSVGIKGPIRAELFIKGKREKEFHLLKTWTNIPGLPPGHKASRDFFISQTEDQALSGGFAIKAVVQPPKDSHVQWQRSFGPGMWGE
jgi:hypothetical protein